MSVPNDDDDVNDDRTSPHPGGRGDADIVVEEAGCSVAVVGGPPPSEGGIKASDDRSSLPRSESTSTSTSTAATATTTTTTERRPRLTNPSACIPQSELYELTNVITMDESISLVRAIDCQIHGVVWRPEGYDRRHRVQRYPSSSLSSSSSSSSSSSLEGEERDDVDMEGAFGWIFDRIAKRSSDMPSSHHHPPMHRPSEVVVIEHTPTSCRSVVRTFERNALCPCRVGVGGGDGGSHVDVGNEGDAPPPSCRCYVAQLTLLGDAIQTIERPANRDPECWDLAEPPEIHETGYVMEMNGVVVRRGDCLWNWRGCVSDIMYEGLGSSSADERCISTSSDVDTTPTTTKKKGTPWTRTAKLNASGRRCITIAFLGMRPPSIPNTAADEPPPATIAKAAMPPPLLPPLSTLLTIVVTTSPIRSHPSTALLERTFDTFVYAGDEFAYECRKVIVCDGCRVLEEDGGDGGGEDYDREEKKDESSTATTASTMGGVRGKRITQKYANTKQNLRNGIATVDQARKYDEFKLRLRELCDAANADEDHHRHDDHDDEDHDHEKPGPPGMMTRKRRSPFRNASVVDLDERHGYGFALRHALCHHVHTPYVCVIQHDRTFMRPAPAREVVAAMSNDPQRRIKYVGMSMRSNLMYHDIFSGKFGRRAAEEFKTMILRPAELCIGGGMYGPDGTSVRNMVPPCSEKRRILLEELKKTYRGSHQCITQDEWLQSRRERELSDEREQGREEDSFHQLSLTPVLFWYDNTHIAETSHYRDFVFHPQYKMVARGGFVEDKLSPCLLRSCERLGLTEGHSKFGCYLLDDHSGVVFTGHLDGGSFMTADLHVNRDK